MPMFKVSASKTEWPEGFNPFYRRSAELLMSKVLVRIKEWEFEAKNEKHVRQLWDEAVAAGIGNIRGFKLDTIARIS